MCLHSEKGCVIVMLGFCFCQSQLCFYRVLRRPSSRSSHVSQSQGLNMVKTTIFKQKNFVGSLGKCFITSLSEASCKMSDATQSNCRKGSQSTLRLVKARVLIQCKLFGAVRNGFRDSATTAQASLGSVVKMGQFPRSISELFKATGLS